ncbi:hypothetical protein DFP73DRAFT_598235 [Morchella snyderi]|nr:hypothetical protein DFP73DRAFT_598235 [Morchella snyderi]
MPSSLREPPLETLDPTAPESLSSTTKPDYTPPDKLIVLEAETPPDVNMLTMEKSTNKWNKENEEQYTLRGWAWYRGDKEARIMIAAVNDREYGWHREHGVKMEKLFIEGKLTRGVWMENDYEATKKDYGGRDLLGPRGDVGIKESTQIGFNQSLYFVCGGGCRVVLEL